jgi:tetratricopeptide (TPR) repeat protein
MQEGNRAHENEDYDKAEKHYRRALNDVPLAFQSHQRASITYNNLALLYRKQARNAEAAEFYERSLAEWQKSGEGDTAYTARVLKDYASLLRQLGREEEASEMAARAATIQR